jgi:hypothetical protein
MFNDLRPRHLLGKLLLWTTPVAWLGCGGGGTEIVLPSLSVTTSTTGVELDPDGYSLVIDGQPAQPIGLAATHTVERLADGQHTVELGGVAANCVVDGQNPRAVTTQSGTTSTVAFAVTCGATSGTIEVSTATSGDGSDPDGFVLLLDGTERGPIGARATATLAGITPGVHTVGITGLAATCQVSGENPQSVTVTASQTIQVSFAINCAAPAPGTGTVQASVATTGSSLDPDGYSISVDGGTAQAIAVNGSLTIGNLPAGSHSVLLGGQAANCTVTGSNPRSVTVAAGQTVAVDFTVTCTEPSPGTGSIQVTVATTGSSPDPDGYTVALDGGTAQAIAINGNLSLGDVAVGSHSVRLGGLAGNCTASGENPRAVSVTAGQTTTVSFAVTCAAVGPSVNLRIEGMYLTQSTQRLGGSVPLIAGREGYLRVFVVASSANSGLRPGVRVRFFRNGAPAGEERISGSGAPPVSMQEGTLGSSWNIRLPASRIQPGLAILADVDPDNAVPETNEGDNRFPSSGSALALTVRAVPQTAIRFVPVRISANGLQGSVGNPNERLALARRMFPLAGVSTDVRSVYTTSSPPPDPSDPQIGWNEILSEIDALRVTEGSNRTYYGVLRLDYSVGIVGTAFVGVPSAIGTDNDSDFERVLAHELGHTWGRWHSPCGNPGGLDPNDPYPYPNGEIGVYGFDVPAGSLKPPFTPDIMSYCLRPWISDHTYQRVLTFRQSSGATSGMTAAARPSVLVWGRIQNGRPVLEPVFRIVTRPNLPSRPGPYTVTASATDGSELFRLSFDAPLIADDPRGGRHFAFAVPLDDGRAAQLASLRLSGPAGAAAAGTRIAPQFRALARTDEVTARPAPGGVELEWNPADSPMILVRDPETGEVLSFARGGKALVGTAKGEIDLEVSDGVQSHRLRKAINRP